MNESDQLDLERLKKRSDEIARVTAELKKASEDNLQLLIEADRRADALIEASRTAQAKVERAHNEADAKLKEAQIFIEQIKHQ